MSTHNIPIFNIKKEKHLKIIPNLQLWDFFRGNEQRVRNSRGKRAISVRAIEVLLLLCWFTAVLYPVVSILLNSKSE